MGLDTVELVIDIEGAFGVRFPDADLVSMKTGATSSAGSNDACRWARVRA